MIGQTTGCRDDDVRALGEKDSLGAHVVSAGDKERL